MGSDCLLMGFLSGVYMFWKKIVVKVAQFCDYTKNHQTVYFKRANFMVSK